ncbi:MAG: tyrosine-type recombinase/integrase [Bacteroidota bacterium]
MIFDDREIKVVSAKQQASILSNCKSKKYRVIILLMLDCGLRVSEVIALKLKDFDFMKNEVAIRSLKKRGKTEIRSIPLTTRLLDAIGEYWKGLEANSDSYLFPSVNSTSSSPHLSRKQVWRKLNKISGGLIHPHMLRHTFATKIVNEGNDILVAQKLLGHKDVRTTQIYTHVSDDQVKLAIQSIDDNSFFGRLKRRFMPKKQIPVLPLDKGMTQFHVGRKEELAKIAENSEKKINTLIKGPQGIGKTHLLDNYQAGKILRVDEVNKLKNMLIGLIMRICADKDHLADMLFQLQEEEGEERIHNELKKQSIKQLTERLTIITEKHEYTLVLDDVTRITPSGVNVLEKLKNHFHIICAARNVKISHISFLTNFEVVELKNLSRSEAIEMINRLVKNGKMYDRIEDYESFKNHVYEQTDGNPLFIIEMVERYSKEMVIDLDTTKDIRHTAALKEVDFSIPLMIFIGSLMVLRYVGREVGDDKGAYMLFGGLFMVFALFARFFFNSTKRKFV